MKRLLLFYVCMLSVLLLKAQPVDVTKLTADTKTYIFSDGKTTVRDYIYNRLQAQSTCCGSNRVYLEVRIDPTGYVLSAKALTGTNECYKESIIDIVKSIRWDATEFKGPKSVFIDLKPDMPCEGRNNVYAKIETFNNAMLDKNGVAITNASSTGAASSNPNQPAVVTPPATTPAPAGGIAVNQPAVNPQPVAPQPVTPPSVTPPATQPMASTQPTTPSQPVVPAGSLVQMNAKPVGSAAVTTPAGTQLPPVPQPIPAVAPPAPRGGPSTLEADKARETQEEIAALRAELDRRAREEEAKKAKAAPTDVVAKDDKKETAKDDKKEGTEGELDWGMEPEKKMDCKPVLGRDGKPLVDKNGKPVMDCKAVVVKKGKDDKVEEAPKPPTPEELAAKKAADDAAAEANKLAKMSPEEKRRYEDEKRRKDADEKMRAEERAMQDKIAAAERSLRDAQEAKRKAEDEAKRKETEIARATEDLQRVKTDAIIKKDEAELRRIDEEKRAAEEKKKEQQREIEKKMDEIKRMQQDMERYTSELQKQQEELRGIEEKRTKLQQEAEIRKNGGTVTMDMPAPTTAPAKEVNNNKPSVKKEDTDTSTVNQLMKRIDDLNSKLYRMQQELEAQKANRPLAIAPGNAPAMSGSQDWRNVPNVPAPAGMQNGQPHNRVDSRNAASDQEWMKMDYNNTEALAKTPEGREIIMKELQNGKSLDSKANRQAQAAASVVVPAPVMPKKEANRAVTPTPAPAPITVKQPEIVVPAVPQANGNYVSTGDKNPDAIHADTYKNIPVASNGSFEFIDGEVGMKNYLRENLKKAGACGVTHVLAEVNVDRNGSVTSYKVLKTTPEEVVAKLPAILLGMKFKTNPATAPYSQTMYVEFKGEIRCEGKAADKGGINQVEPFIKADKK